MAAGLPVIASRTGGIPEILRRVSAFLVTPKSPNELADAIIKALNRPEWGDLKPKKKLKLRLNNLIGKIRLIVMKRPWFEKH